MLGILKDLKSRKPFLNQSSCTYINRSTPDIPHGWQASCMQMLETQQTFGGEKMVLWFVETRTELSSFGTKRFVWQKPNTRHRPENTFLTVKRGGGRIVLGVTLGFLFVTLKHAQSMNKVLDPWSLLAHGVCCAWSLNQNESGFSPLCILQRRLIPEIVSRPNQTVSAPGLMLQRSSEYRRKSARTAVRRAILTQKIEKKKALTCLRRNPMRSFQLPSQA